MAYTVYILECSDGTLYTGVTNDIEKRIRAHNNGTDGAKYTKSRRPVRLVYREYAKDRGAAQQREYAIKQLSRESKQALIQSDTH